MRRLIRRNDNKLRIHPKLWFNVTPSKTKGFEFTSLLGPQKLLLLKKLPSKLVECQPSEISDVVQQIWKVKIENFIFTT